MFVGMLFIHKRIQLYNHDTYHRIVLYDNDLCIKGRVIMNNRSELEDDPEIRFKNDPYIPCNKSLSRYVLKLLYWISMKRKTSFLILLLVFTTFIVQFFSVPVYACPVVTIISPKEGETYYTTEIPLEYKVTYGTDPIWEGYSLDGDDYVTLDGNTILSGLSLGLHTLTVSATETGGYQGEDTVSFTVADKAPVVTIVSPENGETCTTEITLTYTVDEPTSSETYSLDGGVEVPVTSGTTLPGLSLGPHTLTVYAKDVADNQGEDTVSFTVAWTIVASAGAGGSISPSGDVVVADGGDQSFTVTPDAGFHIADVLVDALSVGPVGSYDFTGVDSDHTIEAQFDVDEYTLTVNIVGNGAVSLDPDQATYHYGDVVELTADADTGWAFSGWSGDLTGETNPDFITMDSDKDVTVSFTVDKPDPPPPPNRKPKPVTLYDPTDITNTSMKLTWTKNEDFDFKKYVVYNSTSSNDIGQKVAEITDRSDTSYQMMGLSENTTYIYFVRVYDKGGLFSDSNKVSARTEETKPPILMILSPVNTTYSTSSVELIWLTNEPLRWAGFNLNGGSITTITGNQTISDLEDGLYNLVLNGTDLAGNNGSDIVSFTIDTEPPEITHTPVTDGVEGNPIEVSAIITDESGVSEAKLYYRKGDDTDYVLLEMPFAGADTYAATIPASFVDDETIEYYIFASDGVNEATHLSVAPTSSPHVVDVNLYPDPVALYEPASGATSTNSVELSWSESDEADFRNYVVYMSGSEGELGDDIEEITERSETSHTVEELELDTTFYFSVRAYDTGGLYADSNQLEVHTGIRRVLWSTNLFVFLLLLLPLGGAIYYLRKRGKVPAGIIAPRDELI